MNDADKYKDYVPSGKVAKLDSDNAQWPWKNNWGKHHFLSEENQAKFLREFAKHLNVSKAARALGVSRFAVYNEKRYNPEFTRAVQEVVEADLDQLEEEQHQAAHQRGEDRRFTLKARRPETWGEKKQVQHGGQLTIGRHAKELSDKELMEIILQGRQPAPADFTVEEKPDGDRPASRADSSPSGTP